MTTNSLRYFTVIGSGEFPFDMLRYDRCFPVDPADAANLTFGDSLDDLRRVRRVALASHDVHAPNKDRWRSFDWVVE